MQIDAITIRNYRLFRDTSLRDIPNLCVLVGANGTGKSTLFDVLSFLKDALSTNVTEALDKRGGYREVASRGYAHETIEICLALKLRLGTETRTASYRLEIAAGEAGRAVVENEVLSYPPNSSGEHHVVLKFSKGEGTASPDRALQQDEPLPGTKYSLSSPDILAIKGLGQFEDFEGAGAVRQMIENWHILDFDAASATPSQEAGFAEHLSSRGENLSRAANYLFKHHPERFNAVIRGLQRRIPGIETIEPQQTEDGRLILRFRDGSFKDPFIARHVSGGTLKMFAYLVLLHDPRPYPLLAVEEPENQLYPTLLPELAEAFRDYAERGGQVFISTHSADFLNALKLEEIYCLRKEKGFSTIARAADSANLQALVEAGDLPGYLWKQGLFEGLNRDMR